MANQYQTKTFRTGYFGSKGKINRLVRQGWEVVAVTRYGWSGNQVTMRRLKSKKAEPGAAVTVVQAPPVPAVQDQEESQPSGIAAPEGDALTHTEPEPGASSSKAHQKVTPDGPRKPWYMKWWVWLIGAIVLIGLIGQAFGGGNPGTDDDGSPGSVGDVSSESTSEPIPDLVGMTAQEANEELETAGFQVELDAGSESAPVFATQDWDVVGTIPNAGANVELGSTVTLVINQDRYKAEQESEKQAAEASAQERADLASGLFAAVDAAKPNSSILLPVTSITDETTFYRVHYQNAVAGEEEAVEIARAIFGHTAPSPALPERETVTLVITSAVDDVDHNVWVTSRGAYADFKS